MREYFNRWYSLAPYCLSVVLIEIPFQLLCDCGYLVPAYYMTGQPLELMRFGYFVLFHTAISLTAQGYGFMIGSTLPVGRCPTYFTQGPHCKAFMARRANIPGDLEPQTKRIARGHTNYVASGDLELGRGYVAELRAVPCFSRALFASRQPPP
ncbi:hypothetical protein J6590_045733 [Homalodisca vitripennis]|nr:hypothetical protein J6590_045733 [Homalodisca vitripennis]